MALKKVLLTGFMFCFLCSLSFAEEREDLSRLTTECVAAAKAHKPIPKDFFYKVLHTVDYQGWSGDEDHPDLKFPIAMTIRYAGSSKKGFFWFRDKPQEKYGVTAKSDLAGNFELIADTESRYKDFRFEGQMVKGVVKGLWKTNDGKKSFAFYAKASIE